MALVLTRTLLLPSTASVYTKLWADNYHLSTESTAYKTGINRSDTSPCIVCGDCQTVQYYIIRKSEPETWELMKSQVHIPKRAKSVGYELRNRMHMCSKHYRAFESYQFYIRWKSDTDDFIIINHTQQKDLESSHGSVLHFNTDTERRPFPTTFLMHESRVRGFYPTIDDRSVIIKRSGLQGGGFSGEHGVAGVDGDIAVGCTGGEVPGNGWAGGGKKVEGDDGNGNEDEIWTPKRLVGYELEAWLKTARKHPTWKKCVLENWPWKGTDEENIAKYRQLTS